MTLIKAWACYGKDLPLVPYEYEAAPLLPCDVEIDITHCGICGSDIHTLDSGWGPSEYPVVVGHEIVGIVSKVGSEVTRLKVGDRVGVGAQCEACLKPDCFECNLKKDNLCPEAVWTYNNRRFRDGSKTYGGYAEKIRILNNYAFKIPDSIPSEYAASLMCAGATVFIPMMRYKFKQGDNVGVVGIGGLGHLAIKYADALGCEVTAISRNNRKKEEAKQLGAKNYVSTDDEKSIKAASRTLDYLLITATSEHMDWELYTSFMKYEARIILLAIPEVNLSIPPFTLLLKNLSLTGSLIGSIEELEKMIEFSAKNNVRPVIERFPMSDVNAAIKHVRNGNVRYRVVLEN